MEMKCQGQGLDDDDVESNIEELDKEKNSI